MAYEEKILSSATFWETTTAAFFGGFLGLLLESVCGPLTVIVENASIHKAIQPLLALLKQKGFTLCFRTLQPELNRFEKLWHNMKYEWMALKPEGPRRLRPTSTKFWPASALIIG